MSDSADEVVGQAAENDEKPQEIEIEDPASVEEPASAEGAETSEAAETSDGAASDEADAQPEPDAGDEPRRRSSFVEHDVVYTAVGASAAPDLLRFPPEGSTPFVRETKLGSGPERFLAASSTLMTWGAQSAVGIEVRDLRQSDSEHYAGVSFDEAGAPQPAPQTEVRYSPEGEPYLSAGATAVFAWPGGKTVRKMRVVFTVDEPRRVGFALGSVDNGAVVGETFYFVEQRDDDSVWAVARGFHLAPNVGLLGVRARAALRLAERDVARLIAALAPGAARKAANGTEGD